MALDAKEYIAERPIRTISKMPEPPGDNIPDPDRWRKYADELAAYAVASMAYVDGTFKYAKSQAAMLDKYRDDLLAAYGLSDHPKAQTVFEMAIQSAIASGGGLDAIEKTVAKLAPLLK